MSAIQLLSLRFINLKLKFQISWNRFTHSYNKILKIFLNRKLNRLKLIKEAFLKESETKIQIFIKKRNKCRMFIRMILI